MVSSADAVAEWVVFEAEMTWRFSALCCSVGLLRLHLPPDDDDDDDDCHDYINNKDTVPLSMTLGPHKKNKS